METGRAVLQVKKFNMIQISNIFLLQNFVRQNGNAPFFHVMGSQMLLIEAFVTRIKNVVITKTRSLCFEVLWVPERCFVVNYPPGHSTSK